MLARTPSTFRLIGAGVTSVGALAAIFASGGSSAQTLANLETDREVYLESKCGHIRDAARKVGCRGQWSIEFDEARTAAANAKVEAARKQAEAARKQAAEDRAATVEHQKASAKSDAASAAYRTEAQCLNALSSALIGKRITPADIDRAEKTPTATTDMCEVVRRLQPRLGQLTKQ